MTDDRPRPQYGEYAPLPPVTAAPEPIAAPVEVVEAQPAPRRTWDVVFTTALLLFGVIDVVVAFEYFATLPVALREVYEQMGVPAFTSDALALQMGLAINVVRVVVLVIVIVISLWRIARGRLAFWVPLAGALVAGLALVACILVVMISDPAMAQYLAQQTPAP